MLFKEYLDFLKEYKVVGLALGVIMGTASTDLVNSLVDNMIMPILSPLIKGGGWQDAALELGPVTLSWGQFMADLLNFIILAFAVFFIVKKILNWEKIEA